MGIHDHRFVTRRRAGGRLVVVALKRLPLSGRDAILALGSLRGVELAGRRLLPPGRPE
jgi:hypothetical protein